MSADQARRLGRGLSALLGDGAAVAAGGTARGVRMLPVGDVGPGRLQPRRDFDPDALAELADSIRSKGVLQPILVRPRAGGIQFELIAGERRWRAAQLAQLHEIPAIVREFSDDEVLQVGLIENLQRQDLNPVEEAHAYRRLKDEFGHTQEDIAAALGKGRSHVANLLRLLELPAEIVAKVQTGELSLGHAKILSGHHDPSELARLIVARRLNVREAEQLARAGAPPPKRRKPTATDANVLDAERRLKETLGLDVALKHLPSGRGRLTIFYRSLDQIDDVLKRLGVKL